MAALIARRDLDVAGDRALGHYTHEKSSVGCAAALATLDVIEDEGLCERSRDARRACAAPPARPRRAPPLVGDVRGVGLLLGIELVRADGSPAREEAERVDVRVPRARPVVQGRPGQRAHALAAAGDRARPTSTARSTSSTLPLGRGRAREAVHSMQTLLNLLPASRCSSGARTSSARRSCGCTAATLRRVLRRSIAKNRFAAFSAGIGVTGADPELARRRR